MLLLASPSFSPNHHSRMPESLLPIRCPHCDHDQVLPFISSQSVLTVKCPQCARTWSIEVAALPPDTRDQVTKALERQHSVQFTPNAGLAVARVLQQPYRRSIPIRSDREQPSEPVLSTGVSAPVETERAANTRSPRLSDARALFVGSGPSRTALRRSFFDLINRLIRFLSIRAQRHP